MEKKWIKLILLLTLLVLSLTACLPEANTYEDIEVYPGKILEITSDETTDINMSGGAYAQRVQEANVKITDGPYKGQVIKVINNMDAMYAYDIELIEGREIYAMVYYDDQGNIDYGHVYTYRRDKTIYGLIGLFLVLMIVVGGFKGVRTLITLGLTLVGVYYMLIGIAKGGNPVMLSMIVCVLVSFVTLFIVSGFTRKAVSAIVGTLAGVFVSGILAMIVSKMAVLTGLGTTEAQMLMFSQNDIAFDFPSILFASILLGTLGAVMDVSISIASAINEITEANPFMTKTELFKSGMNIGRDIMGTMANTLILAYTGTAIFLMLVFFMNNIPYFDIINMDAIATEIVRAVGGTVGLILCIPVTAYVAAVLEKKNLGNY